MKANFPKRVTAAELVKLVLSLHVRFSKMDDTSLNERIQKYESYQLRYMSLDELSVDFNGWSRDVRTLEYFHIGLETQPPILIGCLYSNGKYDVVDGHHRAAATKMRGETHILAYVPVEL